MVEGFFQWLAHWETNSAAAHLFHALSGLLGGALFCVIITPEIRIPHYNKTTRRFHLEFVGTLLAGMAFGFIADHSVPVAFLAGLLGLPIATEVIINGVPAGIRGLVAWLNNKLNKGKTE